MFEKRRGARRPGLTAALSSHKRLCLTSSTPRGKRHPRPWCGPAPPMGRPGILVCPVTRGPPRHCIAPAGGSAGVAPANAPAGGGYPNPRKSTRKYGYVCVSPSPQSRGGYRFPAGGGDHFSIEEQPRNPSFAWPSTGVAVGARREWHRLRSVWRYSGLGGALPRPFLGLESPGVRRDWRRGNAATGARTHVAVFQWRAAIPVPPRLRSCSESCSGAGGGVTSLLTFASVRCPLSPIANKHWPPLLADGHPCQISLAAALGRILNGGSGKACRRSTGDGCRAHAKEPGLEIGL